MYLVKVVNVCDDSDEVIVSPKGLSYDEALVLEENLTRCLREPYFPVVVPMLQENLSIVEGELNGLTAVL